MDTAARTTSSNLVFVTMRALATVAEIALICWLWVKLIPVVGWWQGYLSVLALDWLATLTQWMRTKA